VLDVDGAMHGVIDVQELVTFLAQSLGPILPSHVLECDLRLRTVKEMLQTVRRNGYASVDPNESCAKAVELFSLGLYHAPVLDTQHNLLGWLTQVDIVMEAISALRANVACRAMAAQTLAFYGLGSAPPVLVFKSQSVADTVTQLDVYQVCRRSYLV
jgi:CBS-domain-containing membrane protein